MKISRTSDHEVAEVVLRQKPAVGGRVTMRDAVGVEGEWFVIDRKPDPHGWRVTAVRCLAACREHSAAGGPN